MSSTFADPSQRPRPFTAARARYAAVVAADASCQEVVRALLAGPVRQWARTAAMRELADLGPDRPDAVVLVGDFGAPVSLTALRRIRSEVPSARVVVVARDDRSATAARQALNAGADAFVPADHADQTLVAALDAVMAGLVCAPRTARRALAKPTFSHREKEVLELLVMGLTNRQIAARLYLAESTVKTHLASAFAKLGVGARKDAVALLLDPAEGLVTTALPPAAVARGRGLSSSGLQTGANSVRR